MNAEIILKSDVLDIIFQNRNKLYGAYALRKFYPERIKTSLLIMLGVVIAFCVFASMNKTGKQAMSVFYFDDPVMGNADKDKKVEQPKRITPAKKPLINSQKLISTIKIVKDSADKLPDNPEHSIISNITITDAVDGTNIVVEENDGQKNGTAVVVKEVPLPDPAVPVENPEVGPSFPGGINALRNFLQRNLTNPRDLEEGEQVSVQIKFVVGYDGKLQRFETVKDGGAEFNSEVIRVLKKMPQWIAGKSNGRNVSVYYTIPVKFVAND
jgi:periplasmic protein TonB